MTAVSGRFDFGEGLLAVAVLAKWDDGVGQRMQYPVGVCGNRVGDPAEPLGKPCPRAGLGC